MCRRVAKPAGLPSQVSRVAGEHINGLGTPGVNEFGTVDFLTVKIYMMCYLLILKVSEHQDSRWAER
jgi:hypothetical protein